jgi:preprotein translocase subunit SecE
MAKKEEKVVKEKSKENKVKKHFFKDFKAELKKVIWPTPKQLVNNTVAVVVIVVIVGAIVFALDAAFDAINKYGITKLQSYVVEQFGEDEEGTSKENSESENNTSENTNTDENTTTDGENSAESNQ